MSLKTLCSTLLETLIHNSSINSTLKALKMLFIFISYLKKYINELKMLMNYFALVLLLLSNMVAAQLTKTWETKSILEVPESVKYYEEGQCIFVTNVAGKPSDKDGNGFISKLSPDGKLEKLKWMDGFNAPKGMAIQDGLLYVSDIDELVVVNIQKAEVVKKIHQPAAQFLNDVAITHLGDVLVSDTGTSTVYILNGDRLDVWKKKSEWGRINGLFTEKDYVLLGTASNIVKIDAATKKHSVFLETGGQADGIEADGKGGYYYTFWKGELYYYLPGKEPALVLNTAEQNIQSADIGYNPATGEVLVPTFFANQVVAYRLD